MNPLSEKVPADFKTDLKHKVCWHPGDKELRYIYENISLHIISIDGISSFFL